MKTLLGLILLSFQDGTKWGAIITQGVTLGYFLLPLRGVFLIPNTY